MPAVPNLFESRGRRMHANAFLSNLALVLCVAAVTTVVFQRLRQPVVLGYLLAGIIVGPHILAPITADTETVQGVSELGVILLLFGIGLEFTIGKLLRVGGTAALIAVVEVSALIVAGDLAGQGFGWTSQQSLYTGAVVAISSTTIIVKAFEELRVAGRLRDLVLSILIVEDLVAIVLLAGLTALSTGKLSAAQLAGTAGRLALFLAVVVTAGMLVVPRLVRAVLKLGKPETTVVFAVGICFAFALLAQRFGYSVALGAFLAGSLVAESGEGPRLEHLLTPVRDIFGAIFFVSVGMLIDPAQVVANWAVILVLTAVVLAGKTVAVSVPAFLTGAGVRGALQAGMSMAQIGEFSFIIAGLGMAQGAVPDSFYAIAVTVSALTTLTTPWMIRASGPAAAWVDARLPHPVQTFVALYGTWLDDVKAPGPKVTRARRLVRMLILDGAALAAIVIAASRLFPPAVDWLEARGRIGLRGAQAAVMFAALAVTLPFLIGIIRLIGALAVEFARAALPDAGSGKVDLAAAPRRALVVALQLTAAIALGLPLFLAVKEFLPPGVAAWLFILALVILTVRLWRSVNSLQGHVRAGAQVLAEAFSAARVEGAPAGGPSPLDQILAGLGSPERFQLTAGSPAVGRTLAEINLRGTTGATVLAIARAGEAVVVPTGHKALQAGDVLALAGTQESIETARALLSDPNATKQ
jgi:K+:H+ antiporter